VSTLREAEEFLQQARVAYARGDRDACLRFTQSGLELVAGSSTPVESALLVQLAQVRAWDVDPEESMRAAKAAAALARRTGTFEADAELALGIALYVAYRKECLRHLRRAAKLAAQLGDSDIEFQARLVLGAMLQHMGRSDETIAIGRAVHRDAVARKQHMWAHVSAWTVARTEWLSTGDVVHGVPALRELAGARELGLNGPQLLGDFAVALADAGEVEDARRAIDRARRAARTGFTIAMSAYYMGELEWAAGRADRVLAATEEALGGGLIPYLEVAVRGTRLWAYFELGEPRADPALNDLRPDPFLRGAAIENQAFAALADGDSRSATRLLVAAASAWRGNLGRNELRAEWGRAELARREGAPESVDLLRQVEREAETLGLRPIVARARASLSQLEKAPARPTRSSELSTRERAVLELVGAGLKTSEIAADLGISHRTVETHVESAMAKTGARTRIEAAGYIETPTGRSPSPSFLRDEVDELLVKLVSEGLSVTQAAAAVGVSRRTATRRLQRARRQLGVKSNAEAASWLRAARLA
jgi:DNA-binding NarL/FixJ family response regulator